MGKKRDKKKKEERKKGRRSCCEREGMRRGSWTAEEDKILVDFITEHGHGTWRNLPKLAGLLRCGKSCRLRWINYLRPNIKRGPFSPEEENTIIHLHGTLGNKWAAIASHLPGRTDNDIKNFWNSHLIKRCSSNVLDQPSPSSKSVDIKSDTPTHHTVQPDNLTFEAQSSVSTKSKGDYFLRLWNSKVGESFRNINESTNECDVAASHSPTSQTSSLKKVESRADPKVEVKKELEEVAACSDSSKSYEMDDDSSDAMLELLLDFPVGGNDMGFLQEPIGDIPTYILD